jgi:glycosyltransferase involved in cell wall biosynthesis
MVADSFEIILVNDGSNDSTPIKLKELQQKVPNLRVLDHEKNMGYGEALRSGFDAARQEWIFQMDSDGQFDIREINQFIEQIDQYDVIVGYRSRRADAWPRAMLTWGYMILIRTLFGLKVRDVGCAFKLFKRDAWEKAKPIMAADHKIFLVEWMGKLQKAKVGIKELPVTHFRRAGGRSTGARPDVVWAMIKELVSLRRENICCLRGRGSRRGKVDMGGN